MPFYQFFCVIETFATILTNFKILPPTLQPFCTTCPRLRCLPFGTALPLWDRAKPTLAGKWARVTRWYLAINVLPFGRVTLFGLSLSSLLFYLALSFYYVLFTTSIVFCEFHLWVINFYSLFCGSFSLSSSNYFSYEIDCNWRKCCSNR